MSSSKLQRADDGRLLAPFEPTSGDPWSRSHAAHFARRAGFGATPQELERMLELGFPRAVDEWVDFAESDDELELELSRKGGPLAELDNRDRLGERLGEHARMWWIYRLVRTRRPLAEKLTLLWHAHFACRESELLSPELLLRQNQLFRRMGAGGFRELLGAVARDPAMLVFLDNRSNEKTRPNENWARELLELFTLGIDRYTQRDVVEIARAFTGWGLTRGSAPTFEFRPERHDCGPKSVCGRALEGRDGERGVEEGETVLTWLVERDETAQRIAAKLATWFVADEPGALWTGEIARELRSNRFSIRETLRSIFHSRAFYAGELRCALTRTPVDFVVAAARALELQNPHLAELERTAARMGMELFAPPSVAGWKLGAHWVHAGAAVQRSRLAARLANLPHAEHPVDGRAALDFTRLAEGAPSVREIVERLARRVLPAEASPQVVDALVRRIERDSEVSPKRAVRAAIAAWISAPEFSLA